MVTVITTKDDLNAPVHNGLTGIEVSDNDRLLQIIKDYQEVDFYRTPSCKPLPQHLFETVDGEVPKSSIKGTFLVQIVAIEQNSLMIHNQNGHNYSGNNSFLLTITDGINHIKAITHGTIPNLHLNIKDGSKLLLTDTIPIKDTFLQLSTQNTSFQRGSNTFPRPRSANRGRTSGSSRGAHEGRRNYRYDTNDGDSNVLSRPLPKNTLSDFMTSLKLPNDSETEKVKERNSNTKRRSNYEAYSQPTKNYHNSHQATNHSMNNHNHNHSVNAIQQDQMVFEQGTFDENLDADDDGTHAGHRERRNPLPPRLQRAQEARTRRNPGRYGEELTMLPGSELNGIYRNDPAVGVGLPSSSYLRRDDQAAYITAYPNVVAAMNGSTPGHLAYYQATPTTLPYTFSNISNPSYANQQLPVGAGFTNDPGSFCYGASYPMQPYMATAVVTDLNIDSKDSGDGNATNAVSTTDDEEKKLSKAESSIDENSDSGIKYDLSSSEQKPVVLVAEGGPNSKRLINEEQDEKHRSSNYNPRPRWKIGDTCFARWSEDGEYYYATVVQITPPHCTVVFNEYSTYDQVHFSDMELIPTDQPYYQYVPSSEFNSFSANHYYTSRPEYYNATIDGCLIMPEAPPFPFNPDGTQYLCPVPLTSVGRPTRANTNGYQSQNRRNEYPNSTINSSSPPNKDSVDTSVIDSTTNSTEDQQQQQDDQEKLSSSPGESQASPVADTSSKLVIPNEQHGPSGDAKTVNATQQETDSKYNNEHSKTSQENKLIGD